MERYHLSEHEKAVYEGLQQAFAIYQFVNKRVATLALSDGFCKLFGFEDKAEAYHLMDNNMYRDAHPDDVARIANAAFRFATEGGTYEVVYRNRAKDGSGYRIVHAQGRHVRTEDGVQLAHVWYTDEGAYDSDANDTGSVLKRAMRNVLREESMVMASAYDYLTGLPNMTYFFELAEVGKEAILEAGGHPMLLYVDFFGMKFFNARHGFAEGNRMLKAFAKLLARTFGAENCCHIGADHFAVIADEAGLADKLETVFRAFGEQYDGKTPPVHAGIYPHRIEDVPISLGCDRAKLACATLRGTYASAFRYYNISLRNEALQRRYFVENLDTAIREGWIQLYLQPIIRATSGMVCDAEALARWNDPKRGIMSPASFIPALEEAGLIYKLDLYMLDQVLDEIRTLMEYGDRPIVPHSINLSRSDFDACDMVEEIRKRVDAAGVDRDMITIEITESIIGRDFEFMKEQVQRFQTLGFPVWMDDFGNGYSSLNALHSIKFDLIKFDMSFMRRLDEGEEGRIILTELMRMANSLGVDTVCEGVETKEQIRFLQEIGCSKLQGFYFGKPMSIQMISNLRNLDVLLAEENPEESDYYESIGRVNLFDLGVICGEDQNAFQYTFSTIPTAIMEVKDDITTYVRSNSSYRELAKRIFGIDVQSERLDLSTFNLAYGTAFVLAVRRCCEKGGHSFFDERLSDGSVIHAFVRRIAVNPVTGSVAIALAVLSVSDASQSASFADIAKIAAMSANFIVLYTIDPQTGHYTQYSPSSEFGSFGLAHQGDDFFADVVRDAPMAIDPTDIERHLRVLTKDNMMQAIHKNGLFVHNFRLLLDGKSVPVNLRATLAHERDGQKIILGVNRVHVEESAALALPSDYADLLHENEQLKKKAAAVRRVAELKDSVSSLLTNMPGMTFTKDVETGRYLACNQSFAQYANKTTPEEVVGLTDFQIFDPQTAEHFVEDDKKALSMDTAYVFFEDVRDGAGQQKQFQTTKLRFIDNAGRQCLLGLCLDVTDAVRVKRERDTTQMAYEEARDTSVIFTNIAQALAHDCTDLYYVNMASDKFIEYHTDSESGVLTEVRRGTDFFEECEREAKLYIHPNDQAAFVEAMDPAFLAKAFEKNKVFELVYRKTRGRTFFHVRMTVTQMEDDKRFIVIAVSDVDELMRQRQAQERIEEEHVVYSRLHALTGNYAVVYLVDPATGRYREFSSTPEFSQSLAQAKAGTRFFVTMREAVREYCYPDDLDRVLSLLNRQNMLAEIERCGIFSLGYRMLTGGRPTYYMLKAALVEEKEGPRLVVGLVNIDSQVRQEENYRRQLAQAQMRANIDALTGVKNKRAYVEEEQRLNQQIMECLKPEFALVVLDVNDLKKVNDTAGHQMGDRCLRDACKVICDIFDHSPVFRVGGDEFAVISQGQDYEHVEELVHSVAEHNKEALRSGGVVLACGMAKFGDDKDVAAVFKRADQNMYQNKCELKEGR